MSTTLSYGGTVLTPTLVLGWTHTRDSRNLEHPLIGGGADITLAPVTLRRGTLALLFDTEEDVLAAEQLHRDAPYVDIASDERTVPNMRYVLGDAGALVLTLEDATRSLWTLDVDWLEVTP